MPTNSSYIKVGEIDLFFKELNCFCEEQRDKKMVYFGIEEICNISFAETYRAIIDYDFTNTHFRDLLVSQIEALNAYSPNAACFFPFLANALYKKDLTLDHQSFFDAALPATEESINDIIAQQFQSSSILQPEDLKSIFSNNGFMSRFSIKKSNSFQNACIFDSGMSIKCDTFHGFFKKLKSIELQSPQIIAYDGYIQSVSELNLILNYSLENGTSFLILSKGANQDVLNTCAVNLELGKCSVCIIEPDPSFWGEPLSTLSVALGTSIYGSVTGRLLSNFEKEEDKDISVSVARNEVFVKSKLLDLTYNAKTTIFLNETSWKKRGIIFDQLNLFSSMLQQIATCGIIGNEALRDITGIDVNEISGLENEYHPAFSVVRALKEAETVVNKIVNIGCCIRLER